MGQDDRLRARRQATGGVGEINIAALQIDIDEDGPWRRPSRPCCRWKESLCAPISASSPAPMPSNCRALQRCRRFAGQYARRASAEVGRKLVFKRDDIWGPGDPAGTRDGVGGSKFFLASSGAAKAMGLAGGFGAAVDSGLISKSSTSNDPNHNEAVPTIFLHRQRFTKQPVRDQRH